MRQYLEKILAVFSEARWLTRGCLLRCGSCLAFLAIGGFIVHLADFKMPELTNAAGEHFGRDFVQFWTSAQLAATGKPAAAYVLGGPANLTDQAISYPPIVMLLCLPLSGLSYAHAVFIWGSLGLGAFTWSLSRLIGWEMAVFAAIATPAALLNVFLQQNGYYTAALLAGGLMLVDRRPLVSGILFGILSYKPQFCVLLLPALVAGGYWRVLATAALTALVLVVATVTLFGFDTWIAFFTRMAVQRQFMETRVAAWTLMPTVFAMARLVGAAAPAAYVLQGLSAIGAAVGIAVLWRQQCPLAIKSAGLVVAAFLATPYAWDYDAVILAFAAAWLANEGIKSGFASWEKMTVLVLLLLKLSEIPAVFFHLQIAPILLWLSLAVVMRRGLLGQRFLLAIDPVRRAAPQSTG